VNTAAILLPSGIREVVLVVHSVDMPRARAEFEAAGLTIVPAPIALPGQRDDSVFDFLPGIAGLSGSYRVLYEMAGEVVRRIGNIFR
jgi:uncharacterized SAM-binding protein YcdF (DUF218 family)